NSGLKRNQTSAWGGVFYFCSRVRKSGVESQPFITFPEGNGRFVNHFREAVSDNVRSLQLVVCLLPTTNGVDVVCLDDGSLRGFHCQNVIYAAPMFTAPYV